MTDKPHFVFRDGMTADRNYVQWLSEVKQRFRQCQLKAAVRVNTAMLEFYWSLGRDIVQLKAESKWGSGFYNQLSLDLREMFPDTTGFSATNLKYMRRWYAFYCEEVAIRHQLGDELEAGARHQLGDELKMPEIFGGVPWRHHIQIFTKSQKVEEAIFYINKVTTEGWSRSLLEHQMDVHLFQTQGNAITNFDSTLPAAQVETAKETLKKEYDLSFITAESIKEERDLENALAKNITAFLLELGKGFSYVGRQMELQMPGGQTYFPDLVFYHIHLKCYVVVELKIVPFKPEFAGKINFYVSAADELLKRDDDNPTIGLIICRSADKTTVEWSFRGIDRPLGVASYQLEEVVARTIAELEQRKENIK